MRGCCWAAGGNSGFRVRRAYVLSRHLLMASSFIVIVGVVGVVVTRTTAIAGDWFL